MDEVKKAATEVIIELQNKGGHSEPRGLEAWENNRSDWGAIYQFLLSHEFIASKHPTDNALTLTPKGTGFTSFDSIDKTTKLENEIKRLTLENLQTQNNNKELQRELNEAQLSLSKAQEKDIPINAVDRKTVIIWQIIAGVSIAVVFLLKLFGVKGWI